MILFLSYAHNYVNLMAVEEKRSCFMKQRSKKQTKQLIFNVCAAGASLLIFLTLGFKILPPVFLLLAAILCIGVVVLAINILLERYRNKYNN
jgi:fatty acid desaturase